jgi:hypothetical protein
VTGGSIAAGVAVVVGAFALAVVGGWPLTGWVLEAATRDANPAARKEAEELLRGGTWIGVLERAAIVGSVLVGYPEAIAVVVAIKGLGRFPELRAASGAAASERFIIGTLTSFLWAGAVGVGAARALRALG